MMYGQSAVSINEFLDPRWNTPNNDSNIDASTVGKAVLKSRGLSVNGYFYWISIGALIGFSVLFNACFILALTYLNPIGNSRAVIVNEDAENKSEKSSSSNKLMPNPAEEDVDVSPRKGNSGIANTDDSGIFYGIKDYNDMLLQPSRGGASGYVQFQLLFEKKVNAFRFEGDWIYPQHVMFNGDQCVLPSPKDFQEVPGTSYSGVLIVSGVFLLGGVLLFCAYYPDYFPTLVANRWASLRFRFAHLFSRSWHRLRQVPITV